MLLKICIEAPPIHPTLFAFEEVSAQPVGTRSAENCLTVLDGKKRRGKYRMIQFTYRFFFKIKGDYFRSDQCLTDSLMETSNIP